MVFSSGVFLFLFLPAYLGLYYLTPPRFRSLAILAGSYVFYVWWRLDFLFLLILTTLWNYGAGVLIAKAPGTPRARRRMQIGVAGNLLVLGIFKYFNFGVESLNALLTQSGMNTVEALRFILPIGISFYIFQSISFLIDVYRGDSPPARRFTDFAAFIALFPQLIAGPVLRYKDMAPQFERRAHSFDLFSHGAFRFMSGFAQKVLVADTVAPLADAAFALENPSMADAWLGTLAYTVQLYFDFSGYSHMAIGLGLMMGFRFMENFDHPYISRSITEFWRRWHISLSTWLKDYLYIPLGGNRKGRARTYINLMLTMLLGGLWHGANWTFVLWGSWHGALLAIERALGLRNQQIKNFAGTILTLFLVMIGWVMFRAETAAQAFTFYKAMAGGGAAGLSDALAWQITGSSLTALAAAWLLIFAVPLIEARRGRKARHSRNPALQTAIIALFLLAVIRLAALSTSPFLYFQF